MSDVKAVHIHLQIEVPEQLDLADFTRYIHWKAKDYSEHLEVLRVGVKTIYKETPTQ